MEIRAMPTGPRFHLIHGGHKGAEAEFGRVAEDWNVPETTLSFEGHVMERSKNVEMLDDEELAKGSVSMEFVFQEMGRRFASSRGMQRVIQSMFHLVVRSDQLFAIGWIHDDGTVKGGTGWAIELAKIFNRTVHVFDQERKGWFSWVDHAWQPSEPLLPNGKFSATGTRSLSEEGKQAIQELFKRSIEAGGAEH
jgi:hypothetical protein